MIGFNVTDDVGQSQVFFAAGSGSVGEVGSDWQVWNKPEGAKFLFFLVIGGGGGGGGGKSSNPNSGYAGAGGGSSAITRGFFPACFLPDTLYVHVGNGGAGGRGISSANGEAGASGATSYISVSQSSLPENIVLSSGPTNGSGGGGGGGGSNTNATVGGGGGVWSSTLSSFSSTGIVFTTSGQNGTVGSTNVSLAQIVTGGAGGGNVPISSAEVGGNITSQAGSFLPTAPGGDVATSSTSKSAGSQGLELSLPRGIQATSSNPLIFTGGAGGGGSGNGNYNIAGRGGNGSYGCGGGGGGACYNGTAGAGGDGGDGLIIITSYV